MCGEFSMLAGECMRLLSTLAFYVLLLALVSQADVARADLVKTGILPGQLALSDSPEIKSIRELVRQGKIESARSQLELYFAANKNLAHPEILLAHLMLSVNQGRQARQVLERVSVQHPKRLDVVFAFCQLALSERRWFEAYLLSSKWDDAGPPEYWEPIHTAKVRTQLRTLHGVCCERRLAWDEAKEVYQSALASKLSSEAEAQHLAGLARSEFHLGNIDSSLDHFNQLRAIKPESESGELSIARLFESTEDAANAKLYFSRAIQTGDVQQQEVARLAYTRWLIWSNRPGDAADVLGEVASDKQNSERQYLSALTMRMKQDFDGARDILSTLHQAEPTSVPISNQLALVLIENTDEAIRARALQIAQTNARNQPKLQEVWATLGWVQFRLGDIASAEKSLMNSMKNGVAQRDAAYFLSQVKAKLGQNDVAEQLAAASRKAKGPTFYVSPTDEK